MFNTAIIKKNKKKLIGADKVKESNLLGVEELGEGKFEGAKKVKEVELEEETEKVVPTKLKGTDSVPKAEKMMSIDLMLQSAKKKPSDKVDSYSKEEGYFESEKKKNSKYLNAIKSRKGA